MKSSRREPKIIRIVLNGGDNLTAIQDYREKSGMTQQELADVLGVTQGAVANWENGIRKPDIFMLKKIADALHCTADDLLTTKDKEVR
jgi:transcriptional regulator with XRE-family HTH domain